MIKLAILGSTRGTSLQSIIDAINTGRLDAEIKIVVSDKKEAMILTRAQAYHLPHQWLDPMHQTRAIYDAQLSDLLQQYGAQMIVLIGYMRILSETFVKTWEGRIVNVHPSLLPLFAGKLNLAVHQAVLESNMKETGCTVHIVTNDVDGGPILVQKKCLVLPHDTPETLKSRVQKLEGEALVEALSWFVERY